MENAVLWFIVLVLLFIFIAWLVWYFWPRNGNNNEVIVIKKSKNVDIDTPVVEGKPAACTEYIADETVYTPNMTPTIEASMQDYAPVDEEDSEEGIRLTPGLKTPKRN
jgi:hypothetical protein